MKKKTGITPVDAPLEVLHQEGSLAAPAAEENVSKGNRWTGVFYLVGGFVLWSIYSSLMYKSALPVYVFGGLYEWIGVSVMTPMVQASGGNFFAEQLGALVVLIFLLGIALGASVMNFIKSHNSSDNTPTEISLP